MIPITDARFDDSHISILKLWKTLFGDGVLEFTSLYFTKGDSNEDIF